MNKAIFYFLIFSLSYTQSISFGESTRLNYKGHVGLAYSYFPNKGNIASQKTHLGNVSASLDLTLQGDFPYEIRLNTRLLEDFENSDYRRYEIDDFYLNYLADFYEIRAGYQIFSWKTVESVSQADFLNQTDLENDIFDPDKFAELALRLRYIPDTDIEQTIELYYIPYFRTTRMPVGNNRFVFAPTLSNNKEQFLFQSAEKEWRPQIALRYQTMFLEDIDLSLFYFNGYNRFPGLAVNPKNLAELTQQYRTINKAGFTFQGEVGSWLVKGELVYNKYEHDLFNQLAERIRPEYTAYTTGFEYTLYSPFVDDQNIGLILEAIGDTDTGKKAVELEGFRPFQNHLFVGLRYAFNNIGDRSILAGSFIDYKNDNIIGQIEYEERLFNSFKLKITFNYLNPTTDPLVVFKKNDRLKINLNYHF
jgi:hypothetical protein